VSDANKLANRSSVRINKDTASAGDQRRLRNAVLTTTTMLVGLSAFIGLGEVARAQDADAFHELETKYIFGSFTVGSSTGIEGEILPHPPSVRRRLQTIIKTAMQFARRALPGLL
jgi:hypothetical protein